MYPFVGNHVAQELGVEPAGFARQILFRTVCQHVRVQVLLELESLGAIFALENLFRRVHFQMGQEILLQPALKRAEGALIHGFVQVLCAV